MSRRPNVLVIRVADLAAIALLAPLLGLALVGCPDGDRHSAGPSGQPEREGQQATEDSSTIVFKSGDGRVLTEQDLSNATGRVKWEVHAGTTPPAEAARLHQQARQAGSAGELERALALLAKAESIAPEWAYPPYDAAWTHLLAGNRKSAIEAYAKVDAMCPRGFFTTKAALDSLRREEVGTVGDGLYQAVVGLEWERDPAKKRKILRQVVKRFPAFPYAWKELSSLLEGEERLKAIEAGLSHDPDSDTRGVLLINKALALAQQGKREEAKQILGELVFAESSTLATVEIAKWSLAHLPSGPSRD